MHDNFSRLGCIVYSPVSVEIALLFFPTDNIHIIGQFQHTVWTTGIISETDTRLAYNSSVEK